MERGSTISGDNAFLQRRRRFEWRRVQTCYNFQTIWTLLWTVGVGQGRCSAALPTGLGHAHSVYSY